MTKENHNCANLTTVGIISGEKTYTILNDVDAQHLPMVATVTMTGIRLVPDSAQNYENINA